MHPEIMRDQPGNCSKCGMKLVPVHSSGKTEPRAHSHGQSSPGHHDMAGMAMGHMAMASSIDLADPMSRESSGTSWVPDSTPMYGKMFMFGDDMLMVHGGIFPRYTNVSTRRGDDRIDAPNWVMAMFSHPLGENAQLGFRLMMSLDPLTEQGRGYPLLFQTGESWNDQSLHDRQHPHDLFDELSMPIPASLGTIFPLISIWDIPASLRSVRRLLCTGSRPWMGPTRLSRITGRTLRTSPLVLRRRV